MRYLLSVLAIISIIAIPALPACADFIGGSDAEVKAVAGPVLEGILDGFKNDDYAKYSKDFDATLLDAISESKFHETDRQIEGSMGECREKAYLGFLRKGRMTAVFWKARFSRSEDDVLIKLVISKRGDDYLVTGLWFQ